MNGIAATGTVGATRLVGTGAVGTPSPGGGLLPDAPPSINVGDAVTQLLQFTSKLSQEQTKNGEAQVHEMEASRKEASDRRRDAINRAIEAAREAREAAEHHGGLFSFITDNIGLEGLVGLATFQWQLVGADMAAHQAGLNDGGVNALDMGAFMYGGALGLLGEQALRKLSPEDCSQCAVAAAVLGGPAGYALERAVAKMSPVDYQKSLDDVSTVKDDDVRLANKVALTVAMAAAAAGATVLSGGTSTPAVVAMVGIGISCATQVCSETGALEAAFGEKAAGYIALGGAITGAALTLGGSIWSAASTVSAAQDVLKAGDTVKTVAAVANGAEKTAEGVATTVEGVQAFEQADYQHDADLANADAQAQKNVMDRIERIVNSILDDLREAKKSADHATEILQRTAQIHNDTLLRAASLKV